MGNENNQNENLSYSVRLYRSDGTLAQKFIHNSDKLLSPEDVIEMPNGIYQCKYKVAAVGSKNGGHVHDDSEDTEMMETSRREVSCISFSRLGERIKRDYLDYKHDKKERTRATIFTYPIRYPDPSPKIRRSQIHNELVTEFSGDYLQKGLAGKLVDWVSDKTGEDSDTRGGRNHAKAVIIGATLGAVLTFTGFYQAITKTPQANLEQKNGLSTSCLLRSK